MHAQALGFQHEGINYTRTDEVVRVLRLLADEYSRLGEGRVAVAFREAATDIEHAKVTVGWPARSEE